ncbi:MAG: LemA family protein [Patescibacteria group bacterium]
MPTAVLVILIAIGVVVLWAVATFNRLINLRNRTHEAWSDIEVQMKRRYDLIPNLVESVKGYAKHESGVFEQVTAARSAAMQAKTPADHAKAENMLTDTIKSLFAVAEAYPQLQATQNYLHLQTELSDAEEKISAARRFYNANVRDINTAMQVFPSNLIANALGFKHHDFFDAPDEVNQTPKVSF